MTAGQPGTLAELVEALTALPNLDPRERFHRQSELDRASTSILSEMGSEALAEEMVARQIGQTELAEELGVKRGAVAKRVAGRVAVHRAAGAVKVWWINKEAE